MDAGNVMNIVMKTRNLRKFSLLLDNFVTSLTFGTVVLQNACDFRIRAWQSLSFKEIKVMEECFMLCRLVEACETA